MIAKKTTNNVVKSCDMQKGEATRELCIQIRKVQMNVVRKFVRKVKIKKSKVIREV